MSQRRDANGAAWRKTRGRLIRRARLRNIPCPLCGHPIDWTTTGRSDWTPEIDHKVPTATLGKPDNRETNLQVVHGYCNRARHDEPMTTAAHTVGKKAAQRRAGQAWEAAQDADTTPTSRDWGA